MFYFKPLLLFPLCCSTLRHVAHAHTHTETCFTHCLLLLGHLLRRHTQRRSRDGLLERIVPGLKRLPQSLSAAVVGRKMFGCFFTAPPPPNPPSAPLQLSVCRASQFRRTGPGVGKVRPGGQLRPVKLFNPAPRTWQNVLTCQQVIKYVFEE